MAALAVKWLISLTFVHIPESPPPPLHTFRSQRKWTDYRWAFSPGSIKNNLFLPDDFIVMRKGNLVLCILTQNGHNCTIILNWIDAGHSGVIKKTHNTIGDENLRSVEISLLGEIGTRWTRRIYSKLFACLCWDWSHWAKTEFCQHYWQIDLINLPYLHNWSISFITMELVIFYFWPFCLHLSRCFQPWFTFKIIFFFLFFSFLFSWIPDFQFLFLIMKKSFA